MVEEQLEAWGEDKKNRAGTRAPLGQTGTQAPLSETPREGKRSGGTQAARVSLLDQDEQHDEKEHFFSVLGEERQHWCEVERWLDQIEEMKGALFFESRQGSLTGKGAGKDGATGGTEDQRTNNFGKKPEWSIERLRDCVCLHGMVWMNVCDDFLLLWWLKWPLLMFPRNLAISSFFLVDLLDKANYHASEPAASGSHSACAAVEALACVQLFSFVWERASGRRGQERVCPEETSDHCRSNCPQLFSGRRGCRRRQSHGVAPSRRGGGRMVD